MRRKRRRVMQRSIDPDEVLLDAFNLPSFDTNQFEGRVARSIRSKVPIAVGLFAMLIFAIFLSKVWSLQILQGEAFVVLSQNNRLDHEVLFAERGVIYDRYGNELAWNIPNTENESGLDMYSLRQYTDLPGHSLLLGFVGYPEHDTRGYWWRTDYIGKSGIERSLDERLRGENGVRIIEVDALSRVQSANVIQEPIDGENIVLTIDSSMQTQLYMAIRDGANEAGFVGGAGIIMDVRTGEVLAMTSYPEFSSQVMTDGVDTRRIAGYTNSDGQPFLNRAVLGEYTPGSIVKPYVAAAALQEELVTPTTSFLSTGEIRIPNPYAPGNYTVFKDWKAHGWVNAAQALKVSSNVYFYTVGGGFEAQEGLGIEKLAAYAARFGFGTPTGIELEGEGIGVVPTPSWKRVVFGEDDPWLIGNTYHTAIGQFGFLVTPVQAVRYIGAIANGGNLVSPHLVSSALQKQKSVGVKDEYLQVVRRGMRAAAEDGTAAAINVPGIQIAGKTGTAQLGRNNEFMNSWVVGFWPANDPQFAYAVVLEKAPAGTLQGAAPAMRSFFEWIVREQSEYAKGGYPVEVE